MVKLPALWVSNNGSDTVTNANAGVLRIEQDGTQRIEQDTTKRIEQESVVTPKIPAVWVSL